MPWRSNRFYFVLRRLYNVADQQCAVVHHTSVRLLCRDDRDQLAHNHAIAVSSELAITDTRQATLSRSAHRDCDAPMVHVVVA